MLNHCHQTIYFIQPFNAEKHHHEIPTLINDNCENDCSHELEKYVNNILDTIENINKHCEYIFTNKASPICMPPYPRKMESALKRPSVDEITFSNFSSDIYKLIVDGHFMVMNKDRSAISKSDFLSIGDSLIRAIKLFRHDFHHLNEPKSLKDKKRLGELYCQLAGKSILDTPELRIKFQVELLKWTSIVLKNEYDYLRRKMETINSNQ
jgi:hypothetical protein